MFLAAAGCLALAWWQWTRFESASGTFQNLGYALQWPLFAGFCVYAYYKFVRYEEAPPEPKDHDAVTEIPDGLLPERPKPRNTIRRRPRNARVQRLPRRTRQADNNDDRTIDESIPKPATAPTTAPSRDDPQGAARLSRDGVDDGLWLIALCYEMVAEVHRQGRRSADWIGVVHGWVYFVYLLFTANLAVKVRWPIAKTIGVLLAGTIPLLGIIVEHFQTRDIKQRFGL